MSAWGFVLGFLVVLMVTLGVAALAWLNVLAAHVIGG